MNRYDTVTWVDHALLVVLFVWAAGMFIVPAVLISRDERNARPLGRFGERKTPLPTNVKEVTPPYNWATQGE